MAVAQYLKPAVLLTCRRTKLAMQHSIAANVIRSFTFGMAVVKHLKQVIMLKKSLNIIRASNNIAIIPVKDFKKNGPFARYRHFTTMTRILHALLSCLN